MYWTKLKEKMSSITFAVTVSYFCFVFCHPASVKTTILVKTYIIEKN